MAQLSAAITGGAANVAMPSPPPHDKQQKTTQNMQMMPSMPSKVEPATTKMASLEMPVPMGTTIVSNVARDSAGRGAAHCKFIGDKRVEGGCKRRQRHSWMTSNAAFSPMSIAVVVLVLIAYCCCTMQTVEGWAILYFII